VVARVLLGCSGWWSGSCCVVGRVLFGCFGWLSGCCCQGFARLFWVIVRVVLCGCYLSSDQYFSSLINGHGAVRQYHSTLDTVL